MFRNSGINQDANEAPFISPFLKGCRRIVGGGRFRANTAVRHGLRIATDVISGIWIEAKGR